MPFRAVALSFVALRAPHHRWRAVSAGCRGELSQRAYVHENYGVQLSHGPATPENRNNDGVSAKRGRSVLSDSTPRERSVVRTVQSACRYNTARTLRRASRHISLLQYGSSRGAGADDVRQDS